MTSKEISIKTSLGCTQNKFEEKERVDFELKRAAKVKNLNHLPSINVKTYTITEDTSDGKRNINS